MEHSILPAKVAVRGGSFFRAAATVSLICAIEACRNNETAKTEGTSINRRLASLDSCNTLQSPGVLAPGTPPVAASEHNRLAASMREFTHFSMLIPERAKIESIDNGVSINWPDCRGCSFTVRVQSDSSGRGIDGQMRALVAEQRRIDSVNKDPRTVVQEFDVIDGPPVPFVSDAGRGYLVDENCGDCSSRSVVFGRGDKIATVSVSADDDVPELPRHMCEMTVVAKTFAWGR